MRVSPRYFAPENLDPCLRAGLVGHWIGGGSGLTWFDRSGRGNHGTLTNGPVWTLGGPNQSGVALSFDGADDAVNLGSSARLTPVAGFSFCSWLYIGSVNANFGTVISRYGVGGDAYSMISYPGAPNVIHCVFNAYDEAQATLPLSRWVHFGCTNDGATVKTFVDGAVRSSGSSHVSLATGGGVTSIGYDINRSNYPFFGSVYDARLYERAISPPEVALLARPDYSPIIQPSMGFRR